MSGNQEIYIVTGSTGEYSDRSEWTICAYLTEQMAQKHCELAKRWYEENDCYKKRYDIEFNNPYDPYMCVYYTGTFWFIQKAFLRTELPKN